MADTKPNLLVFSTLFPNEKQPGAGVFIRERMFRVAKFYSLIVVAPVPWFPLQGLIRIWKPHFRPQPPRRETQQGIVVLHPRFFSVPGMFKSLDGLFLALSVYFTLKNLKEKMGFNIIDSHFANPDGYAATLLGKWLGVPVTITLRGTEVPQSRNPALRSRILMALSRATKVFSVADSLKRHVVSMGADESKIRVVGNGVDIQKFHLVDKAASRKSHHISNIAPVLISVGGLTERKGFHRVIECLPELKQSFPDLKYLIIGGASAEGNREEKLRQQVDELGLKDTVSFLGTMPATDLKYPLSAADVFVLATRNEGWANVFLEAMACGLPVVTTDVGGNSEVVCKDSLGMVVPFGDKHALYSAIKSALEKSWDRDAIISYAQENNWDGRVEILEQEFSSICSAI